MIFEKFNLNLPKILGKCGPTGNSLNIKMYLYFTCAGASRKTEG